MAFFPTSITFCTRSIITGARKITSFVTIWRQTTQPNQQCALPVQLCTSSPADPEDAWVNRFNWDHIFTPTLLSHFAYGYVNRNEGYGSVAGQSPTAIEIPNAVAYNASPAAGFSGNGVTTFSRVGETTRGSAHLNKTTRPSHIANELDYLGPWRAHVEIRRRIPPSGSRFSGTANGEAGSVNFSALSTALNGVPSGDAFASLLVGAVDSGNLNVYNVSKYGAEQLAFLAARRRYLEGHLQADPELRPALG